MIGGSTISALIEDDDLRLVRVSGAGGVIGLRVQPLGVVPSALSSADAVRAMIGGAPARILLTVPGEWASVRAISVTSAQWRDGAAEIRKSVGGLLPLSSEDAMLGVIDARGGATAEGGGGNGWGGYLVGVSESLVRPWMALLERAAGRGVDRVLTVQMAMLGLGLQGHERADVLESIGGGWLRHRLVRGLVERIGEPWGEGDPLAAEAVAIGAGSPAPGVRAVTGDDLAVAAALAPRVAGDSFVSLNGRPSRALARWAWPAGMVAASVALLVAGGVWRQSRVERATERLDARIAAISADVRATAEARSEAERLAAMIESARGVSREAERKILPLLIAAMESVPAGGFISTIQITPDRLVMRGEAPQAGEVVRFIEVSPEFEQARLMSPVTASPGPAEPGAPARETFDLTAVRTKNAGGSR